MLNLRDSVQVSDIQYRNIVIAATHRSGSYHFCDLLSKLGGLPFPEEHFNFLMVDKRAKFGFSESVSFRSVFEELRRSQVDSSGNFTVKVMWNALIPILNGICREEGRPEGEFGDVFRTLFPGAQILFVRRRDKERQAVSLFKAGQTNVWRHEGNEDRYDPEMLIYDFQGIDECRQEIESAEESWLDFFDEGKLPFREVWYEDFLKDRRAVLRDCLSYLELEPVMDELPKATYEKAPDDVNSRWVDLYSSQRRRAIARNQSLGVEEIPPLDLRFLGLGNWGSTAGAKSLLQFSFRNRGEKQLCTSGDGEGRGWLAVEVELFQNEESIFKRVCGLAEDIPPGESFTMNLPVSLGHSGGFVEGIAKILLTPDRYLIEVETFSFWVSESRMTSFLGRVFPGWKPAALQGWNSLPSLGVSFWDSFPWIFTADHGWLWLETHLSEPSKVLCYDRVIGWIRLELSQQSCDVVLVESDRRLRYLGNQGGYRYFCDIGSGERFRYPRNL
jgi:LPS sulfotransferase NodH